MLTLNPTRWLRPASRRTRPVRRPAFTLIEVLVVVTVIGIAGAIVVPAMLKPGVMQAQAAGRMIIADIIYAQNEAISRQANRRVVFDVANNKYRLSDAAGNTIAGSWRTGGSDQSNYTVDLRKDARFSGVTLTTASFNNAATLEFDALGSPVNGGTVDLTGANFKYRITVEDFTGRVTIAPVQGGG